MRGVRARLFGTIAAMVCLAATSDAGPVQTSYEYDALGRLIRVIQDDGTSVEYSYDAAGNRTTLVQGVAAPSAPSFSISDASVSEGGTLNFTVTKTGTASASHSVSYATANGTAVSGSDYTAASGTLTFAATETSKTVSVATLEDSLFEGDETLNVNLSAATGGATIANSLGVGTITDDDPAICTASGTGLTGTFATLASQTIFYNVGDNWNTTGSVQFRSQTATASTMTADLQFFWNGAWATRRTKSATSTESCAPASISFDEGASGVQFAGDRTWRIRARVSSGADATVTSSSLNATATTPPPSFAISNASVSEGGTLNFTITKTGTASGSHSVSYATANGSAVAGSDYTATSGTLTFAAAETAKTVSVTTLEDTLVEGDETLNVDLSGATGGATIADSVGVGTITDDDPAICTASGTGLTGTFATLASQTIFYDVGDNWNTTGSVQFRSQTATASTVTAVLELFWNGSWITFSTKSATSAESCSPGSISFNNGATGVRFAGDRTWRIRARVSSGALATATSTNLNATVTTPPNSPPNAVDDTVIGSWFVFDTVTVNVLANDSDPNNHPLTITSATCSSGGCFPIISGSSIQVTGTTAGNKFVTYTISDGHGGTDTATLLISEFVEIPGCQQGEICLPP